MHLLDMTGHARTDLDRFDRFRAAGELAPFGHVFLRYRGYGYRGWSRLSRGRGFSMLVASVSAETVKAASAPENPMLNVRFVIRPP